MDLGRIKYGVPVIDDAFGGNILLVFDILPQNGFIDV
jgi:hypothetical protein